MNRSFQKYLVFTFILFNLLSFSLSVSVSQYRRRRRTSSLPKVVIDNFSSRSHRQHHLLFHSLRNNWNRISEELRQRLRNMGWEPPRPSIGPDGRVMTNNDSGEDFLYMHRKMIEEINDILSKGNYTYGKRIIGWSRIPSPDDNNYPVPPAYAGRNQEETDALARLKSDDYYYNTLSQRENELYNPDFLRNMTLGQLGAHIEYEVHNALHARWSSPLPAYRPEPEPFFDVDQISTQWDDPSYDWLNDFYASQINTVFWKLHGWVDDRINDWQRANDIQVIQWKGTWTGPPGHTGHSGHSGNSGHHSNQMNMTGNTNKTNHLGHSIPSSRRKQTTRNKNRKNPSPTIKSEQNALSVKTDVNSNINTTLQSNSMWRNFQSWQPRQTWNDLPTWQPIQTNSNWQSSQLNQPWGNWQTWQPIRTYGNNQFLESILTDVSENEQMDKNEEAVTILNEIGKTDILTTLLHMMKK
jgi:hypothetical protein